MKWLNAKKDLPKDKQEVNAEINGVRTVAIFKEDENYFEVKNNPSLRYAVQHNIIYWMKISSENS